MIIINCKDAVNEKPNCKRITGKKYDSIELPRCLVSDGEDVWEESYDPTEGFNESVLRFIEIKNIKP